MIRPPRVALWLHAQSLASDEREAVVGDLVEEFFSRAADDPRAARLWVWAQTGRSLVPNLRRRLLNRRSRAVPKPPHGARMLNGLSTDLRFALRLLKRQPLMSLVAFLSLTAGLALNILLVTIADAALARALPVRDPGRLVVLLLQRESGLMHNFSYPDYRDLSERARALDGLVAYGGVSATLAGSGGAAAIEGEVVSGDFFATLGVPLQAGRALTRADDSAGAPPAAVVSEPFWRDRLGAAQLSGQTVTLNGQSFAVVGVVASRFAGMQVGRKAEFWVPLAHARALTGEDLLPRPTASWLTVIGRLREGTAADAAREELDAILRRVRESSGRPIEPVVLQPGARGDSTLSEELASPMALLLAAGAVVLLVACLNVANLQLARTEARRRELAVRSALGARRIQLVRLLLIDGCLMSTAAGVAGLYVAALFRNSAASLIAFYGQPVSLSIPLDYRVVATAFVLSSATALVIGVLSTWQVVRRPTAGSLADGRSEPGGRRPAQRVLVVAQVALSMALLTGASMLVRTLDRLRHADLGFDPHRVAVLQVSPEMGRLGRDAAAAYFEPGDSRGLGSPGRGERGRRTRDAARLRRVSHDDRCRRLYADRRRGHGDQLRSHLADSTSARSACR